MPNPKLETYKNKATNTVYDLTDANAQASLTAILDGTDIDSFGDVESALADKMQNYYLEDNIDAITDLETGHTSLHTNTTDTISAGSVVIPTSRAVDSAFSNIVISEFTALDNYAVGDYVKREAKVYKCTTAHSAGAWVASDFTQVKVLNEVKSKDANISANTQLIKDTVGWTNKNEFNPVLNGTYTHGVTPTLTNDKRVSLSGTSDSAHVLTTGSFTCLANVKYVLSGCPSGGGKESSNYWLGAYVSNAITDDHKDIGSGCTLLFNADTNISVRIRVPNALNTTGMVFSPMIRKAEILDSSFEPNRGTTAFPRDEQRVLGAKNLLKNTATSSGIFTVNADGTVTATGSSGASDAAEIRVAENITFPFDVILSGSPSGGSTTTYRIRANASGGTLYSDVGEGILIPANTEIASVRCRVEKNQTVSNLVFKPMIRIATDPDSTYVPYAMTNKELTDNKQDVLTAGTNIAISSANVISTTSTYTMRYSTSEQVVGTWIDNKPIYQKTIDFGACPNATTKEVSLNIANIEKIIYYNGFMLSSDNATTIPLPNVADSTYQVILVLNRSYIRITTAVDRSSFNGYITIRYTKTTD